MFRKILRSKQSNNREVSKMRRTSLVAVAALLAAVMLVLGTGYAQAPALISHAPISISGNAGFTQPPAVSGVVGGSGTPTDPWIIENWKIGATGAANAIYIEDTTDYFIIRNCKVFNADLDGILFRNVENGKILNSEVSSNVLLGAQKPGEEEVEGCGITLIESANIDILEETRVFDNYGTGICVIESRDSTIVATTVERNKKVGIYLSMSSKILIEETTVTSNDMNGIELIRSGNNELLRSTVSDNGIRGPRYNRVGIILFESHDNTIAENEVRLNYETGIVLSSSAGNDVFLNTVQQNGAGTRWTDRGKDFWLGGGIALFSDRRHLTKNNRIIGNTIKDNRGIGMLVTSYEPSNNLFSCSTFIDNGKNAEDNGRNRWDNGSLGNHWSGYTGSDANGNGIGDWPYRIPRRTTGRNNWDRRPLMQPFTGPLQACQ